MVGLCGVIGRETGAIDDLLEGLRLFDSQEVSVFRDQVVVGYCDHSIDFEPQPATSGNDLLWCWGEVLGHDKRGEYTPRTGELTDVEYCIDLYDRYGMNFVAGLNSEFAGIRFDRDTAEVSLFTDRLGSRPIYYTETETGDVVFSSLLQSLAIHPDVELDVDPPFLSEFLAYGRAFGIHTPVEGVRAVPPSSVMTFDLDGDYVDSWRYWWPDPQHRDLSYSECVDRLESTVRSSLLDRVTPDRDRGLLLSGGTDSRLLVDALAPDVTAFHMNERLEGNSEAQTSERVAREVNADFIHLRRDIDYYPNVLERTSDVTNFNGLFRHAHAVGFSEEINEQVDELFCGHYSDTVLGGTYVPKQHPSPQFLRHVRPSRSPRSIDSTSEYVRAMEGGYIGDYSPSASRFVDLPDSTSVLDANVHRANEHIDSHGVRYPDWSSLVEFGMVYPITNTRTFIFYETLCQLIPTRYPFLDNRIVDLALEIPPRYLYRRDIVSSALSDVNPTLASIPHPGHRLPVRYPYILKYWLKKALALSRKLPATWRSIGSNDSSVESATFRDNGSWPDHAQVIRRHPFLGDILDRHADSILASEYLDADVVHGLYHDHLDGEDHTNLLYGIASILESSINVD